MSKKLQNNNDELKNMTKEQLDALLRQETPFSIDALYPQSEDADAPLQEEAGSADATSEEERGAAAQTSADTFTSGDQGIDLVTNLRKHRILSLFQKVNQLLHDEQMFPLLVACGSMVLGNDDLLGKEQHEDMMSFLIIMTEKFIRSRNQQSTSEGMDQALFEKGLQFVISRPDFSLLKLVLKECSPRSDARVVQIKSPFDDLKQFTHQRWAALFELQELEIRCACVQQLRGFIPIDDQFSGRAWQLFIDPSPDMMSFILTEINGMPVSLFQRLLNRPRDKKWDASLLSLMTALGENGLSLQPIELSGLLQFERKHLSKVQDVIKLTLSYGVQVKGMLCQMKRCFCEDPARWRWIASLLKELNKKGLSRQQKVHLPAIFEGVINSAFNEHNTKRSTAHTVGVLHHALDFFQHHSLSIDSRRVRRVISTSDASHSLTPEQTRSLVWMIQALRVVSILTDENVMAVFFSYTQLQEGWPTLEDTFRRYFVNTGVRVYPEIAQSLFDALMTIHAHRYPSSNDVPWDSIRPIYLFNQSDAHEAFYPRYLALLGIALKDRVKASHTDEVAVFAPYMMDGRHAFSSNELIALMLRAGFFKPGGLSLQFPNPAQHQYFLRMMLLYAVTEAGFISHQLRPFAQRGLQQHPVRQVTLLLQEDAGNQEEPKHSKEDVFPE